MRPEVEMRRSGGTMRRWRRRLAAPDMRRRLAWAQIGAAALAFALAEVLRDRVGRGTTPHNLSYLLNVLGLLLAVTGAVALARVEAIFYPLAPAAVQRRAILTTLAGLLAALLGCVALSATATGAAGPLLAALLGGGLGGGLAGLFSLAWSGGLEWAAARMERLDRPEIEERRRRGAGRDGA